jgi:phospholipase/carboxylesterase
MNRLLPDALELESERFAECAVSTGRFVRTQREVPCTLFAPMHYEPKYAYPLLVWLHGWADDENQLKRIMPLVSTRNYVATAPRGTHLCQQPGSPARYGWRQTEADIVLAESRVLECLDLAREQFNIAPRRVFLAGFDCGGTMAFRLAMSRPQLFGGVISLCGEFPRSGTPLVHLDEVREVPVLLACGRRSSVYPPAQVCDDMRLLHSAGIDISLRQYACGQELSLEMLADVNRWTMEQILGQ